MKRSKGKHAAIEEVIRFLDSGLPWDEVANRFSESENKDAELHLRLIRDLRGAGRAVRPRAELLQAALEKIALGDTDRESDGSRATLVKNSIRRLFEARLLVPAGAIAIIAVTIVSLRTSDELVTRENRGEKFAALTGTFPEAPAFRMAVEGDALVSGAEESFDDLFDEGAIAREAARADEDLAAAERFFATDDDVQAAIVNF